MHRVIGCSFSIILTAGQEDMLHAFRFWASIGQALHVTKLKDASFATKSPWPVANWAMWLSMVTNLLASLTLMSGQSWHVCCPFPAIQRGPIHLCLPGCHSPAVRWVFHGSTSTRQLCSVAEGRLASVRSAAIHGSSMVQIYAAPR